MSRPSRRLQWGLPDAPTSPHPYRDAMIVYAVLALVIVLFAWLTGGSIGRALIIAGAVFVAASLWTSFRLRQRIRRAEAEQKEGS